MKCLRIATLACLAFVLGCGERHDPATSSAEAWSVTAWGSRYEVFAETGPLAVGSRTTSNVHVTVLEGFLPLEVGAVTIELRGEAPAQSFRQEKAKRAGIFPVEIEPRTEGRFELWFIVDGPQGPEEIRAGGARVGTASAPGSGDPPAQGATPDRVAFLKEQQWRTEFATQWVSEGALHDGAAGPARVIPAANGAVTLTSAFDATVGADVWPYPGLDVAQGRAVFRLAPRVTGRSLPELEADATALEAEAASARRRVERLEELLRVEATSVAELERAQAALAGLNARLQAARAGVGSTTHAAQGVRGIPIVAPWSGTIAEVFVSAGETVQAGMALARLVKPRPVWLVLALRPQDAARVRAAPVGLVIRRPGGSEPIEISGDLRLVSRSPELDPRTGTVAVIVEVGPGLADVPIGSHVEAELLFAGTRRGIVVPVSALVDDAGVTVAYVQVEGESFARREVRLLVRQGAKTLVEGLQPGERLVTRGGSAIRRSALLSTGAPEGHVH